MNLDEARAIAAKGRRRYEVFKDAEEMLAFIAQHQGAEEELAKVHAERARIEAENASETEKQRAAQEKTRKFQGLASAAEKSYAQIEGKCDSAQSRLEGVERDTVRAEKYLDSLKPRIAGSEANIETLEQQIKALIKERNAIKTELARLAKRFSTDG